MLKNFAKLFLISTLFVNILFAPMVAMAVEKEGVSKFIPCGITNTKLDKNDPNSGKLVVPCTFDHVLILINNIVNFALFQLAVPLAAIVFAYAGAKMIFSGGSSEAMGEAKKAFTNTAIGLIIAVGAWLIIHTLLAILGYDGSWIGL